MFGHVKGAFTDARTDRIGRFELAEGGTLLLDEIGTLEPRQQAKLLRVLETGEVERVGASRARRIDVRILSATNADLARRGRRGAVSRGPAVPSQHHRDPASAASRPSRRHPRARRAIFSAGTPRGTGRRSPASSPRRPEGAGGAPVARQRARAGPHDRAGGAHGAGHRAPDRAISGSVAVAPAARLEDLPLEEVERVLIRKALDRHDGQREPRGQGARPEPQRALPASPASWPLTAGIVPRVTSRGSSASRSPADCPAVVGRLLAALERRSSAPRPADLRPSRGRVPGSSERCWCASASSGRCRRSPISSPRSAKATTRSAPAARTPDDGLGLALLEVNALSETLRSQRLRALEATALLRRVIEEMDAAVFAFDSDHRLRLVNRGGERLLGQPVERLLGLDAASVGSGRVPGGRMATHPRGGVSRWGGTVGGAQRYLSPGRTSPPTSGADRPEPGAPRRGALGVAAYRSGAGPRDQQLARADQVDRRQPQEPGRARDAARQTGSRICSSGLQVIETRSEALGRFMSAYARLARLPQPRLAPVEVAAWVRSGGGARDESRRSRRARARPLVVTADGDQLDQLLINLVRNAADASLETKWWRAASAGRVGAGWSR